MSPELQAALIAEAQKYGAVGDDVIRLFPALTEHLKPEDSEAVAQAVRAMVAQKPRLFDVPKPWEQMEPGSDEWRARERRFRASLQRSRPISNEFSALDAARCSDKELAALSRAVGGCANSCDRAILWRALARQRQEDAAFGGDAA